MEDETQYIELTENECRLLILCVIPQQLQTIKAIHGTEAMQRLVQLGLIKGHRHDGDFEQPPTHYQARKSEHLPPEVLVQLSAFGFRP